MEAGENWRAHERQFSESGSFLIKNRNCIWKMTVYRVKWVINESQQ